MTDVEKKAEKEVEEFKMKIKVLNQTEDKLSFEISGINEVEANTLRRVMISEIPIMAVDEVEFKSNDSALHDEIIAHRLGLTALKTDLKSYKVKTSETDKGPIFETTLSLSEEGPKEVLASDLKPKDPSITPVYSETPIVTLLKDQKLELVATAFLGTSKEHAKYQPGVVYYTYKPKLVVKNDASLIKKFKDLYPKGAIKDDKFDEETIINNNLYDACDGINNELLKIERIDNSFIFYIESFGQLTPKEILATSIEVINKKLEEFSKGLKKPKTSAASAIKKIPRLIKK